MTTETVDAIAAVQPLALTLLSRSQIISADDVKFEDVPVPEWGGIVRIRNLTAAGRGVFIQRSLEAKLRIQSEKTGAAAAPAKKEADSEIEMLLVVMSACDGDGNMLFTLDDIKVLGGKASDPIGRLATVAQRISGLLPNDTATAAKS